MDDTVSTLTLPDGRVLAWSLIGPALATEGISTVFYCHGFPGSRLETQLIPLEMLDRLKVRVVGIDRPGMGRSTPDPPRTLLDWPRDVLAVADHLGIGRFHVLGGSGGAPYALACAKALRHTPRLLNVAVVCGMYPAELGLEGMMLGNRFLMLSGAWLPRALTAWLLDSQLGKVSRDPDSDKFATLFDREMSCRIQVEQDALKEFPQSRDVFVASLREALKDGADGAATDLMLYNTDWGFKLDELDGRGISLWHGRLDQNVPAQMAEKAGKLMPHAKVHIFEDDGHISISLRHCEEYMAELLQPTEP